MIYLNLKEDMPNTLNSVIIESQFDFFSSYSENTGHGNHRPALKKKIGFKSCNFVSGKTDSDHSTLL